VPEKYHDDEKILQKATKPEVDLSMGEYETEI